MKPGIKHMKHMKPSRVRRGESGQTLILVVLALIILVLAIIFLFDLQSVIRVKMKAQTAVDAAALAGANWQKHTLNLIGEMNLIKACTVLITDVPPEESIGATYLESESDLENLEASCDLLSEMQARVSFIGPLIGFAAAQQAAKNNGLNYNEQYGVVVAAHYERLLDDTIYGDEEVVSQSIEGYEWREPYMNMLWDIMGNAGEVNKGVAVAPNTQFLGAPRLTSDPPDFIGYLQDQQVYWAINANYWCYIRDLIKMDFGSPGSKWWGDIELMTDTTSFPEESEYLTVDIDFTEGAGSFLTTDAAGIFGEDSGDYLLGDSNRLQRSDLLSENYDREDPVDGDGNPNADDTDGKYDPLPRLTWATYGSGWSAYEDMSNSWDYYLRDDGIQSQYRYYGAVTKMSAKVEPANLSGDWGQQDGDDVYLGDSLEFGGRYDKYGKRINTRAERLKEAEKDMKYGLDEINASALAKPFGSLPTTPESIPNSVPMILPVFTRPLLIPVALENPGGFDPFDYRWYAFLTEYLPQLGTVNSLDDMESWMASSPHGSWFTSYHNALVKLNDQEWRAEGIAWLESEATGHDVYDEYGNLIEHVTDTTNEDHCDDWFGGPGPGPRSGPSVLH